MSCLLRDGCVTGVEIWWIAFWSIMAWAWGSFFLGFGRGVRKRLRSKQ